MLKFVSKYIDIHALETQATHSNWHWKHKKKLISLIAGIILCITAVWYLADCTCHVDSYNAYFFRPYQLVRTIVLKHVPFSIGDLLYIGWGIGLIAFIVKLIRSIMQLGKDRCRLFYTLLAGSSTLVSLYFLFVISWGGNYYKEPLPLSWNLDYNKMADTSMVSYDRYLVGKLNELAPHYKPLSFDGTVAKARDHYASGTDLNSGGLYIKPSIFGNLMQYLAVQGYYNPFTGEGQVNQHQPAFMFPFVVTHEMAHQAGIGAEDDANLLAYAVSVSSRDTSFMYSAYFNLWLYTHSQVRMRDTTVARSIRNELNPLTISQLDTLRSIRKKYRSQFGNYSGDVYDKYLKMNNQKDGIESYDKVSVSAWLWELQYRAGIISKIYIP